MLEPGEALRIDLLPTSAARALIREAAATLSRIGAVGWRARCEHVLGDGRRSGSSAPSHAADSFGLTQQEMRVAQEIAGGATNREAAARLLCSPRTVEYHLTRVYSKLGVRTRAGPARGLPAASAEQGPQRTRHRTLADLLRRLNPVLRAGALTQGPGPPHTRTAGGRRSRWGSPVPELARRAADRMGRCDDRADPRPGGRGRARSARA